MNPEQPRAEALVIEDNGRLGFVGSKEGARASAPGARVVDLEGKMILPGFVDTHLHALEAGLNADQCDLHELDLTAAIAELRVCADRTPEEEWVVASGIDAVRLMDLGLEARAALDAAFPDRPVLILDAYGHAAQVNGAALRAAAIAENAADPPGGIYWRETGRLTGLVLENAQQRFRDLATAAIADFEARAKRSLLDAEAEMASLGITTYADAGGFWRQGHPDIWLDAEPELLLRSRNAFYLYPDGPLERQIEAFEALRRRPVSDRLAFDTIKLYVDGILSLATGAVDRPYRLDEPVPWGDRGFLYFDERALGEAIEAAGAIGARLHVHVIGERAARLALDALETLDQPGRHRLTHLYQVAPADRPRFAELSVFADVQLTGAEDDPDLAALLGANAEILPVRALIEANAAIALSSDWDADPLSPTMRIAEALSWPGGPLAGLDRILAMTTIEGARALGLDEEIGSLEPGKRADLAILGGDPSALSPEEIAAMEIEATLIDGEPIYDPQGRFAQ